MSTGSTALPLPSGGATAAGSGVDTPLTTEEKILLAAKEAEAVIAVFKPAWAQLVELGISLEPIVSGFARTIAGLFKHHTGVSGG